MAKLCNFHSKLRKHMGSGGIIVTLTHDWRARMTIGIMRLDGLISSTDTCSLGVGRVFSISKQRTFCGIMNF